MLYNENVETGNNKIKIFWDRASGTDVYKIHINKTSDLSTVETIEFSEVVSDDLRFTEITTFQSNPYPKAKLTISG
jgi:hypothetical protein